MRIIFLDIDGVLNSDRWFYETGDESMVRWPESHIDPRAVAVLNEIVERSGAGVVLSSSWRTVIELDDLEQVLRKKGYTGPPFLGRTPSCAQVPPWWDDDDPGERGFEIQEWLDDHPGMVIDGIVIIDDSSDMAHLKSHLVRTTMANGLLPMNVEHALKTIGAVTSEVLELRQLSGDVRCQACGTFWEVHDDTCQDS